MRILISITATIFSYKIKIKNDEILIKTLNETHEIFDKNHMKLNNSQDKIKINQNSVFSSANTIITEKIIFILNVIF